MITGQERFLQPWQRARERYGAETGHLVRLSSTPAQQERARQIQQAVGSYFRDYSVPVVDAARAGDPGCAARR